MLKWPVLFLLILAPAFSHAVELEDVIGAVPGAKVPGFSTEYSSIEFEIPANVQFEMPVPEGPLAEYFQFVTVTVLPPDTVSSVLMQRAYHYEDCLIDAEAIEELLSVWFPLQSEKDQYGQSSSDRSLEMTLGCYSGSSVPYRTLRLNIWSVDLSDEFSKRVRDYVNSLSKD